MMTNVQKNIASSIQTISLELLRLNEHIPTLVAMYATEGLGNLTDTDYTDEGGQFAHITVQEMTAAKNALESVNTAIGAYIAGTNATKLIKIVTTIPK